MPRFKASYPDRADPRFNRLVIDKRFRPRFGLLHAVAKQVYLANDVAVIPQDVHFVLRHLQPPSAPEMQEECHFGVIEKWPYLEARRKGGSVWASAWAVLTCANTLGIAN
jgi:hypothetical protein